MAEHMSQSREAVGQFHKRLDAEQYTAIYDDTDDLFRHQTTEKEFTPILAAVHRKLGVVEHGEPTGVLVNANTGGTFVKLSYKVKFTGGDATESFEWRMSDGKCKLVSYNINSPTLIIK
jgi:Protein of unknown function (DUF4019)